MGAHTSYTSAIPLGLDVQWDPSHICPDDVSTTLIVVGDDDDVIECWGKPFLEPRGRLMVNLSTPQIADFCRQLELPAAPYLPRCNVDNPCLDQLAPYCLGLANGTLVCIGNQPWFATADKQVWWVTERALKLTNGEIALASVLPVVTVLAILLGVHRWLQVRRHRRNLASAGAGAYNKA